MLARRTKGEKMKTKIKGMWIPIVIGLITLGIIFATFNLTKFTYPSINYKVEECENIRSKMKATYNKLLNSLIVFVDVNCCSDEIKVIREGDIYKILERDYDGMLCRCICTRKIIIFNVTEPYGVVFVNVNDKEYNLTSQPKEKFCGRSTFGKCESDEDCVTGGCSGQVCQSRFEKPVITTCEWKECYNAEKYGMMCKCVEGKCQWS
jgi:eight-cysteine-cluster-containing protein